ncbi:MAG: hypothetical protein C0391_02765 [Anaerolinea sp.]|nr:hypothetical protein [Anaerolinea sp.]
MPCPETIFRQTQITSDFSHFLRLAKEPKRMLNDLFETAWKQRELTPEQHAPAFLLAWTVLAATAEITTGEVNPESWSPAICVDADWAARFNNVMDNPKSLMRMYVKRFAASWPIFTVADLKRVDAVLPETLTREAVITAYRSNLSIHSQPDCWLRHLDEGANIVPDWQHTLSAWVAVRRNLFVDSGWYNTENTARIVANAFLSLIYFLKESKLYFENPSLKPDIFDRTQVLTSL